MATPENIKRQADEVEYLALAQVYVQKISTHEVEQADTEELPGWLKNRAYVVGGDTTGIRQWDPKPGEELVGRLESSVTMSKGGTAYRFDCHGQKILLTRGGVIFADRINATRPEAGDFFYMKYKGELPAKQGQNPARDWLVIKLL